MPRIPEPEIERLKSEVSVERLVEASGIDLKRSGKDWLGRCPFHEDDTASLVVTPAKNLWHCFGCGVGGGPIDWVMKRQGVSFRHAVELLREGVTPSVAHLSADGVAVKRSSVRALPPPVAFDADDQALLNPTENPTEGQVLLFANLPVKLTPWPGRSASSSQTPSITSRPAEIVGSPSTGTTKTDRII